METKAMIVKHTAPICSLKRSYVPIDSRPAHDKVPEAHRGGVNVGPCQLRSDFLEVGKLDFVTDANLIPCKNDSNTEDLFEDQGATIQEARRLLSWSFVGNRISGQYSGATTFPIVPAHQGLQLSYQVLTSPANAPLQSAFQPVQVILQNAPMSKSHCWTASMPFIGLTDEFERFLEDPLRGTKQCTLSGEFAGPPPQ
ncbi:hypothetical protein DPMN_100367 [Dreissena polymorpha]|uniref:Uncharacterized protein n=1 Tax=Dreissena polymorpha TaxID=45954 RepID=A0A9D4LFP2_DREPO|nr:hypothetical protein DPMN_100367 [Dreissena polymorpha]